MSWNKPHISFGTISWLFSSGHFPVLSIPCWVTLKRTFRLAPRSYLSGLQSHDRNAGSGIVMVGDERSQSCRKNVTTFFGSQQRCYVFSIRPCCETYTGGGLLRKQLDFLQVVSYLFLQHFLRQIHVFQHRLEMWEIWPHIAVFQHVHSGCVNVV